MSFDATEVVGLLTLGIHDAGVYFPEHARVLQTAATLAARLEVALAGSEEGAFLGVVERRLVYEGRFLLGPTLVAKRLIDSAESFRCGGFTFRRGVSATELVAFFAVCAAARTPSPSLDDARRLLRSRGVLSVELSAPSGSGTGAGSGTGEIPGGDLEDAVAAEIVRELGSAIPAFQRLREGVEISHATAEAGRDVDVTGARDTVATMVESMQGGAAELLRLCRYPDYASYTVGHSVRVSLLAIVVGRHLGLAEEQLVEVGTAGLLHDVGKSRIPQELLFKRGRLDAEERRAIAAHTTIGAKILLATRESPPVGIAAAFGHHLRHDGGGYPERRVWGVTGRVTALIHVCDVFEALTAVRPYKPSLSPRRAYEIMVDDRGSFDPSAFAAFVAAVGFYPPGSRVRLTSGEEAFVLRAGRDPARPKIVLTHDATRAQLPPEERAIVDLSAPALGIERTIEGSVSGDDEPPKPSAEERASTEAPLPARAPVCCHDRTHEDSHDASHAEAHGG